MFIAKQLIFHEYWTNYVMSEYFHAYLPFMVITYVFHITIGVLVLAQITGKTYTGLLEDELPIKWLITY